MKERLRLLVAVVVFVALATLNASLAADAQVGGCPSTCGSSEFADNGTTWNPSCPGDTCYWVRCVWYEDPCDGSPYYNFSCDSWQDARCIPIG